MSAWRQRLLRPFTWLSRAPPVETVSLDKRKYAFPPRLLIYQDSKYYASIVSFFKVFAIFPSIWVTWNLSWPAWNNGNKAEAVNRTVMSLLPIPLANILTGSYVVSVFLPLPPAARTTPQALKRWLQKIPLSTKVQFQTIGWFAAPVINTHPLDRLRPLAPKMLRIAQFSTIGARSKTFAPGRHFYIRQHSAGREDLRFKNVWPELAKMINKQQNW